MRNSSFHRLLAFAIPVALLLVGACAKHFFRSNYSDAVKLLHSPDAADRLYLKAHMQDGRVFILRDTWHIDTLTNLVQGEGEVYDYHRKLIGQGSHTLSIDSVLIFETNKKLELQDGARIGGLSLLGGINLVGIVFCIVNPKACFGSCPTFYINAEDDFHYADAEGFSNAIAPSMAYADMDALNAHQIWGDSFCLTMKNEALETHCVQDVRLLAYPLEPGERVYHTRTDEFYLCSETHALSSARTATDDITALLSGEDRVEWFSSADEHNLKSREEIYLTFEDLPTSGSKGLVLHFRQTLMTTYFIYSALDYMGDAVGDIFAQIEGDPKTRAGVGRGIYRELGDIDVFLWQESAQQWVHQGGFYETGPIAINRQLLPLAIDGEDTSVHLKLVLNKGLWRLDYAALTTLQRQVAPKALMPVRVLRQGKSDAEALACLLDADRQLNTLPGSAYRLDFQLPEKDKRYELFLRSEGYYLEWMRDEWLQSKDLRKLRQMIARPRTYLREEAAAYKVYEQTMEEQFWNSRITTNPFAHHDQD